MNNKKNLITSIILQGTTIVSGLILPRLIISYFGSDVNGMISSITQFLSFINLLEGGLGAVVLAELYYPLEKNDIIKVSTILVSCKKFFRQIAIIFILFTMAIMIIYPLCFNKDYSFEYISSLILIISVNTLTQYLFSVSMRLLLQADQKLYVVNIVSAVTIVLNTVVTLLLVNICPNIHFIKLLSSVVFFIQPIFYSKYIKKNYSLIQVDDTDKKLLANRWSGFLHNAAGFVNMNIDIILLTLFSNFKEVSVYSVYMLALNALRNTICTAANSYQSALGKYIAQENQSLLEKKFRFFSLILNFFTVIIFGVCLYLINSFTAIYTIGITDVSYYRPLFAVVITSAQMVYCLREPYRILILAAGKFKETNFGSVMEAIINLVVSVVLVDFFGIIGVAVGTLAAMLYRLCYFLYYLKKNIIQLDIRIILQDMLFITIFWICNIYVCEALTINILSWGLFIKNGFIIVAAECLFIIILFTCYRILYSMMKKMVDLINLIRGKNI